MLLCWLGKVMVAFVPGTAVLVAAGRGSASAALAGRVSGGAFTALKAGADREEDVMVLNTIWL